MKTKILITEQDKMEFLMCIGALKSGLFRQVHGVLEDQDGYCCLGLGVILTCQKNNKLQLNSLGEMIGGTPSMQPNCSLWMRKINMQYMDITGSSLVERNDNNKWSFDQIADDLMRVFKDDLED